jgi:hypothetical protein
MVHEMNIIFSAKGNQFCAENKAPNDLWAPH